MKYYYFVRHGESTSNAGISGGIGTNPSLSKKGLEQAYLVAKRCVNLPIELIISSTMNRAMETANIIHKKVHVPMEFLDIFVERRMPSAFSEVSETAWTDIRKSIKGFFYTSGFRHSDEENFEDIQIRGSKCLEYLKSRSENRILVVAHGSFLRDLISLAIFKKCLTPELRGAMTRGFTTVNTGITVLTFDEDEDQWSLLTWNDHAHLG